MTLGNRRARCLVPAFDGAFLSPIRRMRYGQILHGCATTTEAVRRAIQNSQESLRALARRYGINQKTVAKWKQRETVADRPTGPKEAKSTVLSIEEEAIIVAFRRHTLLPLDDCLYALQPTLPHLTRSSLHRCLQRHGISRLPEVEGSKPSKKKFKAYPIGYFHIDIAEVQTAEGKLYLYVAMIVPSKFAFVRLVKKTGRTSASVFLEALIAAVPYKIHTVLTDNGIQFTFPPRYADGPTARYMTHMFDMRCQENDIEHRLTKIKHPWTNGQVERMNRTIKEATVQRYHYDRHDQLEAHPAEFINAYNYARRPKTLKGLTPYEYICKCWTSQPEQFKLNPLQKMPGINSWLQPRSAAKSDRPCRAARPIDSDALTGFFVELRRINLALHQLAELIAQNLHLVAINVVHGHYPLDAKLNPERCCLVEFLSPWFTVS